MNIIENIESDELSIRSVTAALSLSDKIDHFLARLGYRRNDHKVEPGLYALGNPDANAIVFVTANYTLSFDALRASLKGMDAYILVLDTKGINVWCAAGKGTFGTDELVNKIESTSLSKVVKHRTIIVPQLGAPGVAAHEVKKQSGFKVVYGPVRADDIPQYLKTHEATPEMRRVHFALKDRLILIPVELIYYLVPMLIIATVMFFIGGLLPALAIISAFVAGTVLFPILLPWIPTANFSTKGFILGSIISVLFMMTAVFESADALILQKAGMAVSYIFIISTVTAFITLNFTGATTFTSRSGVKREIYTYIPVMAWMFGSGLVISLILTLIN